MKYYIITILLLTNATTLFSQTNNLPSLQGFETPEGSLMLEISGYDIYIDLFDGDFDDPYLLDDIKSDPGFENILSEYTDQKINVPNKVIEAETVLVSSPYVRTSQTCYLIQTKVGKLATVLFLTINPKDRALEQAVVEEYLRNGLSPYVIKNRNMKSFTFAGRTVTPKDKWEMVNPHAVSSEGVQLRWSEFSTAAGAASDIANRLLLDKSEMKVDMEESINVVFEGIPTKAIRVVYSDGSSEYPLIAYYVSREIRGRNVSCIMSNYGNNKYDYYLNALLEEVMTIPNPPANAFKLPQREPEYIARETESYFEPSNFMDFQIGSRIPIGNLSSVYSSAPFFALYFKVFSVKATMFDVGLQIGMPSGVKYFDYNYSNNQYGTTKTDVLLNINMRVRREKRFQSNLRLQYYVGAGYESMGTDLYKDTSINEYGEEVDHTYSVMTMDFFGGINLKHKYVGLFLEYHYTPYSLFDKVKSGFGSSALHAGILLTL